jgi:RNAse (barnase) inhibitor barstar
MATPTLETLLELCRQPDGPAVVEAAALSAEEAIGLVAALAGHHIRGRVLDGARLTGKADLLRELAAAFDFPSYFGHNWDALIDCWSDMFWLPGRGYVCVLLNADAFAAADADAHAKLLNVCQHVAERWLSNDDQFVFKLVRAAGPGT